MSIAPRHVTLALLAVILFFCATPTNALFTFLTEGTPYCFIEDLNEDTPVLVSYKCPTLDAKYRKQLAMSAAVEQHEFSIKAEVRDPFGNVILDRKITDPEGTIHFKSLHEVSGIYEICFSPTSLAWFASKQKIVREIISTTNLVGIPHQGRDRLRLQGE
jgi:hypothetical protein